MDAAPPLGHAASVSAVTDAELKRLAESMLNGLEQMVTRDDFARIVLALLARAKQAEAERESAETKLRLTMERVEQAERERDEARAEFSKLFATARDETHKAEAGAGALRNALEAAAHACHEMHTRAGDDAAGPIRAALATAAGAKAAKVLEAAEKWDGAEHLFPHDCGKYVEETPEYEECRGCQAEIALRAAVDERLGRKP
jgi:hypothetical protein